MKVLLFKPLSDDELLRMNNTNFYWECISALSGGKSSQVVLHYLLSQEGKLLLSELPSTCRCVVFPNIIMGSDYSRNKVAILKKGKGSLWGATFVYRDQSYCTNGEMDLLRTAFLAVALED